MPKLKQLIEKLDFKKSVSGENHNASKMWLVNIQKLFTTDVFKTYKDLKDDKTIDKSKLDNYNKFTSESGHWYAQDGEPMYTLIGANGKERNTTLRDAKSLGLVPSVTTIIGMIAKPSLENWKISQAIRATELNPKSDDESIEVYINRCKQEARKVGLDAAKQGTKIHAQIERTLLERESLFFTE